MKPKLAIVLGFILAAGVVLILAAARQPTPQRSLEPAASEGKPPPPPDPGSAGPGEVDVTFEYSSEKADWIEAAVAEFQKTNPQIHVVLIGKGSLESAAAIVDGTDHPVVWSPADSLVLNLATADWQARHAGAPLFATTGDAAPQPLVLSPLVFVAWDKHARPLDVGAGPLSWKTLRRAIAPNADGKPARGGITLGHTDPGKSNSGLAALVGMTYEYFGATSGLTAEQLIDPRYLDFLRDIERGVPHFEASTGTLMTDMIRFGPSKYDVAVVYESTAVSQLERAQGRWGNLHIYYPPTTIWSDHPVVVLDAPWVTPVQKAAGEALTAFLRSTPVQKTALRFGFRPADDAVAMKTADPANPFTKHAKYGLSLELPPAAQPPDAAVVRNLLMLWSRVTRMR